MLTFQGVMHDILHLYDVVSNRHTVDTGVSG